MSQITATQVLDRIDQLIPDEGHWCHDDFAQLADGAATHEFSPLAVRFCVKGAYWRALKDLGCDMEAYGDPPAPDILDMVARQMGYLTAVSLNDQGDFALVQELLHRARGIVQRQEGTARVPA